jgi:hypothetical protein
MGENLFAPVCPSLVEWISISFGIYSSYKMNYGLHLILVQVVTTRTASVQENPNTFFDIVLIVPEQTGVAAAI